MHPLIDNLSALRDSELDEKINMLTKRYFMASNPDLKQQIITVLNMYREEQSARHSANLKRSMQSKGKDLDSLIDVS